MLERLTPDARAALDAAEREARTLGHDTVGSEHLVLALASAGTLARTEVDVDELRSALTEAAEAAHGDRDALAAIGIDLDEVHRRVEELYGPRALARNGRRPRRSASVEQTLAAARREARSAGTRRIGPDHLLLGVFTSAVPGAGILLAHGVTRTVLRGDAESPR